MKILFINASVREESRTKLLTDYLLSKLNGEVKIVHLGKEDIKPLKLDELKLRDSLVAKKDFNNEFFKYAKDFKESDIIVISAPYWDLSFPALLKIYLENINVVGLTFEYGSDGMPHTLSKAKSLYYVTTSGGPIISDEYGFGYVKTLAQAFYQIGDIKYIKAEGLDIIGADVNKIIDEAKTKIDDIF